MGPTVQLGGSQRHFGCTFLHISTYAVSSQLRLGCGNNTFIFVLGPETSSNGRRPASYAPWLRTNIKFAQYVRSKPLHHTKHNIGYRGRRNLQTGGHTCSVRYVSVPCVQYLQHILVQRNTLTSWRH